ncbi:MAG: tyrosine-type recombinase/integrase [Bacteroidetes bacterium]|nr:tyrosine-type recombinase/integrase [Bacteroidota bacterium]MBS1631290.1 tyrosine-type recombinase/integrase [Bacteroidota bacterium]
MLSLRDSSEGIPKSERKSRDKKAVSVHCLRHCFATHLLEKGIDIRYIKENSGYFSYHNDRKVFALAKEKLISIQSPLDDIWGKGKIKW